MAYDLEEQEQLASLKAWWKDHGTKVLAIVAVYGVPETAAAAAPSLVPTLASTAAAALEALPELTGRQGRRVVPPTCGEAEAELAALTRLGGRLVATGEAEYPRLLAQVDAAPPRAPAAAEWRNGWQGRQGRRSLPRPGDRKSVV